MANGAKRQSSEAPQTASKKSTMSATEKVDKIRRRAKQASAVADQSLVASIEGEEWPKAFYEKIKEREAEILERLEKVKNKLEMDQRKFETGILAVFRQAILPIEAVEATGEAVPEETKLKVEVTAVGQQIFGDRIVKLLDASQGLVKNYQKLSAGHDHESRLDEIRATFKKDKQAALTTLSAGGKVATADIQNMLVDRYHEVRGRSMMTQDEDAKGRMLLSKGEEGGGNVNRDGPGWGTVALDIKKGIDKLSQAISKQ